MSCCNRFQREKSKKDISAIKPHLAGGLWLGERCLNASQKLAFRKDMEEAWKSFAEEEMAKKILRGGDSQANEALHSIVACLYRKDIAHGNNMNFSYAAAASVMKMSLGTSFVTVLAKAMQTQLPPRASAKNSLVDKNKTRLALHKQKPISKKFEVSKSVLFILYFMISIKVQVNSMQIMKEKGSVKCLC
jgi:hypothetical protein